MSEGTAHPIGLQEGGFTLIEMVASLAIAGILAAIAGIGLVQFTEGFALTRRGAETTQKAQLAMSRMIKEFNQIIDVSAGDSRSIRFESFHADEILDQTRSFSIAWSGAAGDALLLTCRDCPGGSVAAILVDNVVSFGLSYFYYDAAGNLVTAASRTSDWAAAFANPARQTGLRLRLQLQDPDFDQLATTILLGKHD